MLQHANDIENRVFFIGFHYGIDKDIIKCFKSLGPSFLGLFAHKAKEKPEIIQLLIFSCLKSIYFYKFWKEILKYQSRSNIGRFVNQGIGKTPKAMVNYFRIHGIQEVHHIPDGSFLDKSGYGL